MTRTLPACFTPALPHPLEQIQPPIHPQNSERRYFSGRLGENREDIKKKGYLALRVAES